MLVGEAHTLRHIVARHADAFEDALGNLLQHRPANIALIASAAAEAVEQASRSVQVSYYRARAAEAWTDCREGATVEAYERLSQLVPLQDDEAERLAAARQRLAQAPPSLEYQANATASGSSGGSSTFARKHRLLHAAWQDRTGPDAHAAWEDAARAFRKAIEIMYPAVSFPGPMQRQTTQATTRLECRGGGLSAGTSHGATVVGAFRPAPAASRAHV